MGLTTSLRLIESRIDWISCSASDAKRAEQLATIADAGIGREISAGDRRSYFGGHGYEGSQAGHWKLAEGEKGTIVQVGGVEAAQWATSLLPIAEHVSRIDYCATLRSDLNDFNPVRTIYRELERRKAAGEDAPKAKHIEQLDEGQGVMVGSRSSAYVIRCYNKTAESGGLYPPGTWRWEVEMKRHASEGEHARIAHKPARLGQAADIVKAAYGRWQLVTPWDAETPIELTRAPAHIRDTERALEWLRRQVAPCVDWLVANGYDQEVRAALNLPTEVWQKVG